VKEDKEHNNGFLAVATKNDCKSGQERVNLSLLPSSTNYAKIEELGFF
jgi:hypothetical protein